LRFADLTAFAEASAVKKVRATYLMPVA